MSRTREEMKKILDIIGIEYDPRGLTPHLVNILNAYGEYEYEEGNRFGYDFGYNEGYAHGQDAGYYEGYKSGRAESE